MSPGAHMSSKITFKAKRFRRLQSFCWSPEPVSVLVGPNGVGKTTVLDLLRFLSVTFSKDVPTGLGAAGGGDHFRSRGALPEEMVEFDLTVGDIRWSLRLPMTDAGLVSHYGEELYQGETRILRAAPFAEEWELDGVWRKHEDDRCCARRLWDQSRPAWMQAMYALLYDIRTYDVHINEVAHGTTREDRNSFLHGTGRNLWAVLSAWKQAPLKFKGQYEWVLRNARIAFPDLIDTIEFEGGEAYIFPPGASDPADGLPPRRQPDGLLTGLCYLTALAGARPGSVVGFDEVENQLHPHAIRILMGAIREIADERGLKVVLTTHSPVVLDAFRETPNAVFVLDADAMELPVPLDRLKNPEWLGMFSLGRLYDGLKFGAPRIAVGKG